MKRGRPAEPADAIAIWLAVEMRRGKPPHGLNWACKIVARDMNERVVGENLSVPGVKYQHRSIENRRRKDVGFRDYTSGLRDMLKIHMETLPAGAQPGDVLTFPLRMRMGHKNKQSG